MNSDPVLRQNFTEELRFTSEERKIGGMLNDQATEVNRGQLFRALQCVMYVMGVLCMSIIVRAS